jgi:hypothetical protein
MNFFAKKVAAIWLIVLPLVAAAVTFLFGTTGVFWEWKKADTEVKRLDIDRARASYEIREKMTALLSEILKLESNSPERMAKEKDFNAAEQNLARIEGRSPNVYSFIPPEPPTDAKIR